LVFKDGDKDFKLGERVELYPSNLDMSTNVYDRYYVARGEQIVDVWPIMGRSGAHSAEVGELSSLEALQHPFLP
jgi:hypothetical protein